MTFRPTLPLLAALVFSLQLMLPSLAPASEMPIATAVVETAKGTFKFTVERAETPNDKSRGLMHRKSMPQDHGMIFTWDSEQNISMWMANTIISLDMVFIKADGRVHRVHENAVPFSRDVIDAGAPVKRVLELNAGSAARIGLKAGDTVTLK